MLAWIRPLSHLFATPPHLPRCYPGGGVNAQGNSYTTYSTGGYSYSNASPSGGTSSHYYTPTASSAASGSGMYTQNGGASGGGYSFYQSASGSRTYK